MRIDDPGDTIFLEQELVDKLDFADENDRIWGKKVVTDAGDSEVLVKGQIVSARKLRDENSSLKRRDLKLVQVRDAVPAPDAVVLISEVDRHFYTGAAGYYPRRSGYEELHECRIVPGDHEGAQRGRYPR